MKIEKINYSIVQILTHYLKVNVNKDFYLNVTSCQKNLIISKVAYNTNIVTSMLIFDLSKMKDKQRFNNMLAAWEFTGNISENKVHEILSLIAQIINFTLKNKQ